MKKQDVLNIEAADSASDSSTRVARRTRRAVVFVSAALVATLVGGNVASASTSSRPQANRNLGVVSPARSIADGALAVLSAKPKRHPVLNRRVVYSSRAKTVAAVPAPVDQHPNTELMSAASTDMAAAAATSPAARDAAILFDARAIGGLEGNGANTSCPKEAYRIRWETPTRIFVVGDYVGSPHAPAPGDTFATGVVVCGDFTYGFRGFISGFDGSRWRTSWVPSRYRYGKRPDLGAIPPRTWWNGENNLDGITLYEPQTTCSSSVKPGVAMFRSWAMARVPGTRDGGIVRGCGIGGNSEHKEGRAFDFMANAYDPGMKAAVDEMLATLTSPDEHGNQASGARKFGIMYIIWNRQIWRSYRPSLGWQPYTGPIPHTDHVHFSFSWAGAMGETSFWTGRPVGGLATDVEPLPSEPALRYMAGQYTSRDANGMSGADAASADYVPGPVDVAAQNVVTNDDGSVSVFTGPNPNYWSYFDSTLEDIADDDY